MGELNLMGMSKSKKHKLVLFIDNSSIDNMVNTGMIRRNCFAEKTLCYSRASEAMEYLRKADASQTEEIPAVIFLTGQTGFIEMFNTLSDRIRNTCKIVIMSGCLATRSMLERKDRNVIAFMDKPLHKFNLEAVNTFISRKDKGLFGKMFN